jgi:hypothetical protein
MATTESTAQAGKPAVPSGPSITTHIVNRSTVENACEDARVDIDDITNNYTDPARYGATCFAVTVDRDRLVPFLVSLGTGMADEAGERDVSFPTEPANDLAEATCTDDTDLRMTVYFPGWSLSSR